jgi:hypothetical protein
MSKPKLIPETELIQYVKKHQKSTIDETILSTFEVVMRIMALAINSEEGWGTKRTQRLIDRIMQQFECITSGTLSGEDIIEFCNEKKINVDVNYDKHKKESEDK